MTGWQPIETCPRHTDVLFYREDAGVMFGQYTYCADWVSEREQAEHQYDEDTLFREDPFAFEYFGACRMEGADRPTHWQPLPEPPSSLPSSLPEREQA